MSEELNQDLIERLVLVIDPIGEGLANHYTMYVWADEGRIECPQCGTPLKVPDHDAVFCICGQGYRWKDE